MLRKNISIHFLKRFLLLSELPEWEYIVIVKTPQHQLLSRTHPKVEILGLI